MAKSIEYKTSEEQIFSIKKKYSVLNKSRQQQKKSLKSQQKKQVVATENILCQKICSIQQNNWCPIGERNHCAKWTDVIPK